MSQPQEQQQNGTHDTDSVNRFNVHNETPLISAVKAKDVQHVMNLIAQGANVNTPDQNGWTPLHYATQQRSVPISRFLLHSGADIEARNSYQQTPLIFAAQMDYNLEIMYLLLKCGADMGARDNEGHGIDSYLSEYQLVKCTRLWISYHSSPAPAM